MEIRIRIAVTSRIGDPVTYIAPEKKKKITKPLPPDQEPLHAIKKL